MSSFLKNTGDIILDAVLTDEGRRRLSLGDGSFRIAKFSLGDDEINYGLYNGSAAAGSEDTELMKTPVFEAYTNNAASMKSRLITVEDNNLLYLPVLVVNTSATASPYVSISNFTESYFVPVFVNSGVNNTDASLAALTASNNGNSNGIGKVIYVDQGLNNADTDATKSLKTESPFLYETEYNVLIDDRLAVLRDSSDIAITNKTVDDDGIATYKFTENTNSNIVKQMPTNGYLSTLQGTRGSTIQFKIKRSYY